MKSEPGKNQRIALFITLSFLVIAGSIWMVYYLTTPKPLTRYNFYGNELEFRDDLKKTTGIPVYPDKESILNAIWDPEIYNITIVYKNSTDNGLVAVNAFEITYKMNVAYGAFNWFVDFQGKEVDSYENLTGDSENLVIALVPPSIADEDAVRMEDHVIYIKGTTNETFDWATMKFIMTALNITV